MKLSNCLIVSNMVTYGTFSAHFFSQILKQSFTFKTVKITEYSNS